MNGGKKDFDGMVRAYDSAMSGFRKVVECVKEFEDELRKGLSEDTLNETTVTLSDNGRISITAAQTIFSARREFSRKDGKWVAVYRFHEIHENLDGERCALPVTEIAVDPDGNVLLPSMDGQWLTYSTFDEKSMHARMLIRAVIYEVVGTYFDIKP